MAVNCPFSSRRYARRAFTLIELLVVIAIIAILATILFPVFGRARENARRSSCSSNLKQLGLGMLMYAQDYDETFPKAFAYNLSFGSARAQAWDTQIQPYVAQNIAYGKRAALFTCPSDTIERAVGSGDAKRTYGLAGAGTLWPYMSGATCAGAGENKVESGFAGPTTADADGYCYSRGRRVAEIPAPADTLEMVEVPTSYNVISFANHAVVMRPVSQYAKTNCPTGVLMSSFCGQDGNVDTPIHMEGWNYLFADGHVKWLRPEATKGTGTVYAPKGMWTIAEND